MLSTSFMRDLAWHHLGLTYQYACICVLALFLQFHTCSKRPAVRAAGGVAITAAMLAGQPFIYNTATTPLGIANASMCCLAAWSLLYWTFLHHSRPSVLHVLLSPTMHALQGVIKVNKRMQRHAAASKQAPVAVAAAKSAGDSKQTQGKPLVIINAAGDPREDISTAPPTPVGPQPVAASAMPTPATAAATTSAAPAISHTSMLPRMVLQAAITLAVVAVTYDVGFTLLCWASGDMCSGAPIRPTAGAANRLLQQLLLLAFSYAGGMLLQLQMELMYTCMRLSFLAAGWAGWPHAAALAADMPARAFNATWAAKSISELWGFRWHQFLRFHFEGLGYAAMDALLPPRSSKVISPALRSSLHTVAAFVQSGLMHEYLTWAAFGTVTGYYMAFFGLHCAAVLLEGWAPYIMQLVLSITRLRRSAANTAVVVQDSGSTAPAATVAAAANVPLVGGDAAPGVVQATPSILQQHGNDAKRTSVGNNSSKSAMHAVVLPAWLKHAWAFSVMLLLSPLFVEPYRTSGYFGPRAFFPLGEPVTPHVLQWASQLLQAQLAFVVDAGAA